MWSKNQNVEFTKCRIFTKCRKLCNSYVLAYQPFFVFCFSYLSSRKIKWRYVEWKSCVFAGGEITPPPHEPPLNLILYSVYVRFIANLDNVVFLWCLQTGSVASSCNPASGRSDIGIMWGGEFWLHPVHVELASALRLASTWSSWGSPRSPGCLRRGAPGQRGNPAAKSFHVDQ